MRWLRVVRRWARVRPAGPAPRIRTSKWGGSAMLGLHGRGVEVEEKGKMPTFETERREGEWLIR